jgi:predicted naringenin-chalcone synthase
MTGRNALTSLLALAALALPAHLSAQEQAAPAAGQEAADETAQIQSRLQQIQQRALQQPALQEAQQALGEELVATMARVEPTFTPNSERAEAMQADIAAAQEAGDNERLRALAAESEVLERAFAAARERAMQDEAFQERMQTFRQQVVAAMIELDSETETLLARLNELRSQ